MSMEHIMGILLLGDKLELTFGGNRVYTYAPSGSVGSVYAAQDLVDNQLDSKGISIQ